MKTTRRSLATLLLCLISLSIASGQQRDSTTQQSPVPIVTATASTERVLYVSIGEAYQTRLQVFSPTGAQSYDSGLRLGNLVDWQLQDQQGQRLGNGSYLFVVTVSDFSGRLIQKYGTAVLEEGQVYLEQSSLTDLSQAQGAILKSSKQAENLSPIDRIGAAGLNRAALADRTTSSASAPVDPPPSAVSGTGTAGKIVKWADDAGTLVDSNLFEDASGRVGLGTTDLSDVLLAGNDKFKIVDGTMTFSFRDFSSGQGYFAIGSSTNGIKGFVGHTNSTDGFTMGSFSNHKLTLRTNSINRLTIDTAGNVGIGTASPLRMLQIGPSINAAFTLEQGTTPNAGYIRFGDQTGWKLHFGRNREFSVGPLNTGTNGVLMTIQDNGRVGIGTTTPSATLQVNGHTDLNTLSVFDGLLVYLDGQEDQTTPLCIDNVVFRVGFCSSSLRYKTDVTRFSGGLDLIDRLRPVSFTWKRNGMHDIGLAAEEVEEVEPLLTFRNGKGEIEGVRYNQLSAVFINAFKEQQAQIQKQQRQLAALRKSHAALNARLRAIERTVKNKKAFTAKPRNHTKAH
jgi:Chaperone of endosialidase